MRTVVRRAFWILSVGVTAVAGCSPGPQAPPVDGPNVRRTAAAAYGRITDSVNFVVNGVQYATAGATVTINGEAASLADLAAGQIVALEATLGSTSATVGVAKSINGDFAIAGTVDSVDAANAFATILGQPVRLGQAVFDASIPLSSIAGLAVGDKVKVSGFRNGSNEIVATWVGRAAASATLVAKGAVSDVRPGVSFRINGLRVDHASTLASALAEGDVVEARGKVLDPVAHVLTADAVLVKPTDVIATAGDYVSLEGYTTKLDPNEPLNFEVVGLPITKTTGTLVSGVVVRDEFITVKGGLASTGTLFASQVSVPFAIPPGAHTLEGRVFDAFTGPVANIAVNVFVILPNGSGYSYWLAAGQVLTDSAGRYKATGLPDSKVVLWAAGYFDGFYQPCGVAVDVSGDVTRDIEVVTSSTLNSLDPPRPLSARSTTLTGTVHETTAAGSQPLAGAVVEVTDASMLTRAITQTDLNGRYFLCDLPAPSVELAVYKDGYDMEVWPVDSSQSANVDIEFKRETKLADR
jgi:hypothetical protein